jgi:hypothetical protein
MGALLPKVREMMNELTRYLSRPAIKVEKG